MSRVFIFERYRSSYFNIRGSKIFKIVYIMHFY